jgi:hypothetical protein
MLPRVIAVESELNALAKKTEFESALLKKELSHSSSTLQLISSSVLRVSVDIIVLSALNIVIRCLLTQL